MEVSDEPSTESVVRDSLENNNEVFSEWKLLLKQEGIALVAVAPGYRNKDFRNTQGISVVDPEIYTKLYTEFSAVRRYLSLTNMALALILCLVAIFLPVPFLPDEGDSGWLFLAGAIGSFLLAFAIFHFISNRYLFQYADNRLVALVDSYQALFLEAFGVHLSHNKSTTKVRWWKDNSGICLRRPRTFEGDFINQGDQVAVLDEGFPPIFIHHTMPGDIHVNEKSYDPSMRVDDTAWKILQETHQELIQMSPILRCLIAVYFLAFLIFMMTWVWTLNKYGFKLVAIVYAIFNVLTYFISRAEDRRNLKVYHEVTRRVNDALQKDEQSAHLSVAFVDSELPGRSHVGLRRYQFGPTSSEASKEIVQNNVGDRSVDGHCIKLL